MSAADNSVNQDVLVLMAPGLVVFLGCSELLINEFWTLTLSNFINKFVVSRAAPFYIVKVMVSKATSELLTQI